jgi:hypothetical protein
MEDFIYTFDVDENLCDKLIEYHKNNNEYKGEGMSINTKGVVGIHKDLKDSVDVSFFLNSTNKYIVKYINFLKEALSNYCVKYNLNTYALDFNNIIQWYPPGGGFKKWHNERPNYGTTSNPITNRALVYMTYLNTVNDKGETEFKYQNKKFKAEKGKSLIWPSDFTHTHRGIPSPTEEKYIATGWFIIL